MNGRDALAVDINPVAACISGAKAHTPSFSVVEQRIDDLRREYSETDALGLDDERTSLPTFFEHAFHPRTLNQVLFLRRSLDWKHANVDCFIAALTLGSLHGEMDKSDSYLSNQMPRTISTKPAYSVRYWTEHHLLPREKETFELLRTRAKFRLEKGRPPRWGIVALGDARNAALFLPGYMGKVSAVVTSPPYLNVTSYEEDQWLRLWFLGGQPQPTYGRISKDDRHTNPDSYWRFLAEAWRGIAALLAQRATIVCRIGGKNLNPEDISSNLHATLRSAFPLGNLVGQPATTLLRKRQTRSFIPGTRGCGYEIDFVFRTS